MTERTEHLIRTSLILASIAAIAAALIWAPLDETMRSMAYGALVLLVPAALDALRVARRQQKGSGSSVLLVLCVLLVSSWGCGASALATQADLVALGGLAAAEADEVLVRARRAELDGIVDRAAAECSGGACTEERELELEAELAAGEARWAGPMGCRALVVDALRDWLAALDTAKAAKTEEIGLALLIRLGGRFVLTWGSLEECVEGVADRLDHFPSLPGELQALAGAGQ